MRHSIFIPLLASLCVPSLTAIAQDGVPSLTAIAQDEVRRVIIKEGMPLESQLVKGKPYSADSTTDTMQTLADGNRIVRHSISKFSRDSVGRTRREQTFGNVDPANPGPHEVKIFIDDPVGNVAYVLDPQEKTSLKLVRSRKFLDEHQTGGGQVVSFLPSAKEPRNVENQDLGTKTIDGVVCTGTQKTVTIPAGQIGNEQAISIVTETWYAPSIDATVQSSTNDPRFGLTVYQLHNVQVGEQPGALFETPADYKLQHPRE
jgi:hypothetical protein